MSTRAVGSATAADAPPDHIGAEERAILARFDALLARALARERSDRPFVTLTFAQSVDGSIARAPGTATALSNPRSLTVTHLLRARHDAILVGIGTVLADDPQLNVRFVDGPSPEAVVLDSRLRFPLGARLLSGGSPLIATTARAQDSREATLCALGARVVRMPTDACGLVDLGAVLAHLRRAGVRSLMVEGGSRIITSVLRAAVADYLVLTIAPLVLGGLRAVNPLARADMGRLPPVEQLEHAVLDDDLVLTASLGGNGDGR